MENENRLSIHYKLVIPWALPLLGLLYGFITLPSGIAGNLMLIPALLCSAGAIFSWLMGNKISNGLKTAVQSANATANGDFTFSPKTQGKDELAHLIYTMGNLSQSVRGLSKKGGNDDAGKVIAINKVQTVIEFNMDGTIITANDNFLGALGYSLDEIKGKHHSMFVDQDYKGSQEYRNFWDNLNNGKFESAEYKRIAKGGREIWIQASYNPLLDESGKPYKVVKFATDVSKQKMELADNKGKIDSINISQATIEFNMDGTIITANDNFLSAVGYSLDELVGKHHNMFVEAEFKNSPEYQEFWGKLNRGEYEAKEYKRLGKNGKEIWIQASYNPILDLNGKPCKVVKFATDITAQVNENKENLRIKRGLDSCAVSCLMVADEDYNLVSTNKGVQDMFISAEAEIKKSITTFSADKVLGQNIDIFHKDPSYQREMLNNLTGTHSAQLELGNNTFDLIVNPILDENNKRIGTVVEWKDVTEILTIHLTLQQQL